MFLQTNKQTNGQANRRAKNYNYAPDFSMPGHKNKHRIGPDCSVFLQNRDNLLTIA